MEINNWYKLSFQIEVDLEEIIVWKLNDLRIFSYAFESVLSNKDKKKVFIWLPFVNWPKSLRTKLERNIGELLENNSYYFKSSKDMQELFVDLPQAINNLRDLSNKIEVFSLETVDLFFVGLRSYLYAP